jgi:hypothetical protein
MDMQSSQTGWKNPFVLAVGTAVISCGALGIAIVNELLGPDIGEASDFCEALRDGFINQPANTWSNLGFVFAGLTIGWLARHQRHRMDGLVGFYACVVVLLGPASAAMHATGTAVGKSLDLTSMFLISSFAAAYALKRWYSFSRGAFFVTFGVLLVVSELAFFLGGDVPIVLHAGNAIFAVLLVVALVVEVRLWRRHRNDLVAKAGLLAVGSLVLAFTIWLFDQGWLCDPHSLAQGHAMWHILCAVAAFWLSRLYIEAEYAESQ